MCRTPTIQKQTRTSKEGFFGCARFPRCRDTLPIQMTGALMWKVQEEQKAEEAKKEQRQEAQLQLQRHLQLRIFTSTGKLQKATQAYIDIN